MSYSAPSSIFSLTLSSGTQGLLEVWIFSLIAHIPITKSHDGLFILLSSQGYEGEINRIWGFPTVQGGENWSCRYNSKGTIFLFNLRNRLPSKK